MSLSMFHQQWENLNGSLNYTVEVVPLGHLCHRCLCMAGNCLFPSSQHNLQLPVPSSLTILLRPSSRPGFLESPCSSLVPLPTLFITMDVADYGWGFQSLTGHQG